jgi:hypothetical protein
MLNPEIASDRYIIGWLYDRSLEPPDEPIRESDDWEVEDDREHRTDIKE